jgi:hypothetical protein
LGSPFSDNGYSAFSPAVVPFAMQFNLTSLFQYTDLQALFLEYQVLAVQVEFQSIVADSQAGNYLHPECVLYTDNADATPPTSVQLAETHVDLSRVIMDGSHILRRNFIPRPSLNLFGPATDEFAYLDNSRAIWLNFNTSADCYHYGFKGLFRQFPTSGTSQPAIRIALTAWLACRRSR